jgi:hypothetical protein
MQPNHSLTLIATTLVALILVVHSEKSAEAGRLISMSQGEHIIQVLASDIVRQYQAQKHTELLPIYFWKGREKIILLKGTDMILTEEHGGPAVIDLTHSALQSGPYFANTNDALSTLANFPSVPKFRPKIVELLDSPNSAVRVGALLALSRMPHTTLIPKIKARLTDESLDVRTAAIIAFGPTDNHVFVSFMLESPNNEAYLKKLVDQKLPISLPHPYRNEKVYSILEEYLSSPIRIKDMPVILQTVVNLQMNNLLRTKAVVHSRDPITEEFMQQCYRELGIQQ